MINPNDVKKLREITGAGMLDCKKALEESNGDIDRAIDWLREKGISKAAKKADRIATEGLCNVVYNNAKAIILEINCETDFVARNSVFNNFLHKLSNILLNSNVDTVEEALNIVTEEGKLSDLIINMTALIGEKISLRRFQTIVKQDDEIFGSYLHMGGKIAVLSLLKGDNIEVAKDIAMQGAAMNPKYISKEDVNLDDLEHEKAILKEQAINEGKPINIIDKMIEGRINKYYQEVCLEEQSFVKNNDITIKQYVSSNDCQIIKVIRFEVGEGMEKRNDNFAKEVMNQLK